MLYACERQSILLISVNFFIIRTRLMFLGGSVSDQNFKSLVLNKSNYVQSAYLMLLQRRELSSEGVDVIRNQGPKREK